MDAKRDIATIALLPVTGDLDVASVGRLRAQIDSLIARGCRRIVLNLADCPYVDSAGMGLILGEIRSMREHGGLLSLTNVSDRVMRTFRICRVVDMAPVSGAGPRPPVPALDPCVQALWRSSVKVDPDNMAETRLHVEHLLRRVPLSDDARFDANLAIGEAIGNAVDHTDAALALVTLSGYADRVVAEVADCGCGFDCEEVAGADSGGVGDGAADEADDGSCPCGGAPAERGRGIKLMRLLADSVDIRRRPNGGTVVRIVKLVG